MRAILLHPDSSDHSGYSRLGFTVSPQFEHSKDRHNLPWPLLDCISCCTRPLKFFSGSFFFFALPRTRWSWMGVDRGRVVRIEVWSWLGNLPGLLLHFIGTEYLIAAGGEDGSGPPIPRPSNGCCYKATLVYWLHLSLECFRAGWPWEGGITFVEKVAETHRARQGRNGQLLGAKKPWARKSPIKAPRCLEPNCLNNKRVLGCCAGDGTLGRRLTSWIGVVLYGVYRTLGLGFYSFVSL